MQCRHCQAWNGEDERRCVRCGRRLRASYAQVAALGSGGAALETVEGGGEVASEPPEHVDYQPSLFRDVSGGPKVIPIPTLTPARPASGREDAPAERKAAQRAPRQNSNRAPDSQKRLEFDDTYTVTEPALGWSPEGVIFCAAPVAPPQHRAIAAMFDGSMVMIGAGIFLSIFYFSGGEVVLSKQTAPLLMGMVAALAILYRALWCLAGGDTPGMIFAGLRLVDFDGHRPNRTQRGLRQVASLLSYLSAGLGLVWALVDEEDLTWHDHISQTFPTAG